MNIERLRIAVLLAAVAVMCGFAAVAACSAERRDNGQRYHITFAMNLPTSLLGRGSVTIWDDMLRLQAILKKDYRIDLKIKRFNSWNSVIEQLESGGADAAWLPPYYYMQSQYAREIQTIRPIAIYESVGNTSSRTCVYMMPESIEPNMDQMLDSLFGKRLALADESSWALLNLIFKEQEYKFEPHYFFHNFNKLNRESSALALLFNAVDAVVLDELSMKYVMLETDMRLAETLPVACTGPLPNTTIVVRANIEKAKEQRLEEVLFEMHSNPGFAPLRKYFRQTGGRWVSADGIDFSAWKSFYNRVKVNGWDKIYRSLPFEE